MSMDSIRFSRESFAFSAVPAARTGRKAKTGSRQTECLLRPGMFGDFCYAAGAVTAVVSGAVSDAVSSGTVLSANFSGWLARS